MTGVLIVDDDRDHAESLADVIEMRGHIVQLAHCGEEAVAHFRAFDFDFVLLDVKLPGINGVETFLEMKKIRPTAKVMLMTGYSLEQLIAQALDGGALGVLQKPFPASEVLALLHRIKVAQRGLLLLADDDPDFVETIVPVLEGAGYGVDVAMTGVDAMKKMVSQRVDCLLLDLCLSMLSGSELYARLSEVGRRVPTVLMTGSQADTERDVQLRSKTCGMLFKPFDPTALLAAIESAVSRVEVTSS